MKGYSFEIRNFCIDAVSIAIHSDRGYTDPGAKWAVTRGTYGDLPPHKGGTHRSTCIVIDQSESRSTGSGGAAYRQRRSRDKEWTVGLDSFG